MNIKCYFFLLSSFVCSAGFLCAMEEGKGELSNKTFTELAKEDDRYNLSLNKIVKTKLDKSQTRPVSASSTKSFFKQPRYMIPLVGAATCFTGAVYSGYRGNIKAAKRFFCGQLGFMSFLPTDCFFSWANDDASQPDSKKYEIPNDSYAIETFETRVIPLYPGADQLTAGRIKELYKDPSQGLNKNQQQQRYAKKLKQAKQPLFFTCLNWLFSKKKQDKNKSVGCTRRKKLPYDVLLKDKIDAIGKQDLEKALCNKKDNEKVILGPAAFSYFIKNIDIEKLKPSLVKQNFTRIKSKISPKYLTMADQASSEVGRSYEQQSHLALVRIKNFEEDIYDLTFGNMNNSLYVLHRFNEANLLSPMISFRCPDIWLTKSGLSFFLSHCQTVFNVKDYLKLSRSEVEYEPYGQVSVFPREYWIQDFSTHREGRKYNVKIPSLFVMLLKHMKIKIFTCFPENKNRQLLYSVYFHGNKKSWIPGFFEFIKANKRAEKRKFLYKKGDNMGLPISLPIEILVMIAEHVQGSSHELPELKQLLPKDYFQEVDRKEYNQESEEEESDNDPDEEDCYSEDEEQNDSDDEESDDEEDGESNDSEGEEVEKVDSSSEQGLDDDKKAEIVEETEGKLEGELEDLEQRAEKTKKRIEEIGKTPGPNFPQDLVGAVNSVGYDPKELQEKLVGGFANLGNVLQQGQEETKKYLQLSEQEDRERAKKDVVTIIVSSLKEEHSVEVSDEEVKKEIDDYYEENPIKKGASYSKYLLICIALKEEIPKRLLEKEKLKVEKVVPSQQENSEIQPVNQIIDAETKVQHAQIDRKLNETLAQNAQKLADGTRKAAKILESNLLFDIDWSKSGLSEKQMDELRKKKAELIAYMGKTADNTEAKQKIAEQKKQEAEEKYNNEVSELKRIKVEIDTNTEKAKKNNVDQAKEVLRESTIAIPTELEKDNPELYKAAQAINTQMNRFKRDLVKSLEDQGDSNQEQTEKEDEDALVGDALALEVDNKMLEVISEKSISEDKKKEFEQAIKKINAKGGQSMDVILVNAIVDDLIKKNISVPIVTIQAKVAAYRQQEKGQELFPKFVQKIERFEKIKKEVVKFFQNNV